MNFLKNKNYMKYLLYVIIFIYSPYCLSYPNIDSYFDRIKKLPHELDAFISKMPKGGDLHIHVAGATYAENLMQYGIKDYCIDSKYTATILKACPEKNSLNYIVNHPDLFRSLIDAWSMKNFNFIKNSGRDHFFSTFDKFAAISDTHTGQLLAEIVARASKQHEKYLEIMITPDHGESSSLGKKTVWSLDLTKLKSSLLNLGLKKYVNKISLVLTHDENQMENLLNCDSSHPSDACRVKVQYIYTIFREQQPAEIFAQLVAGFEVASKDSRFVGIDIEEPEDGKISLRDYDLHMKMIGYLHRQYPNVKISLHAGELPISLVLKKRIKNHIRNAIELAYANRIGHGTDVLYENNYPQLLKYMSQKNIAVEINLTSNADILNMKDDKHPLPLYIQNNVPTIICTDDEGVLRTNLNKEYARAISTYNLSYKTIKNIDRNSITYSFLPGKSLWVDNNYQSINTACRNDNIGEKYTSNLCKTFLFNSPKAAMQWKLEKDFFMFEKSLNES
jgi:adenosine deaminase